MQTQVKSPAVNATKAKKKTALILGATGRFGRHISQEMQDAGWKVICQSRKPASQVPTSSCEFITSDIFDRDKLIDAANHCDAIINALNPPYADWKDHLPAITQTGIDLARVNDATLMMPGNVYNFGSQMPPLLTPSTPQSAATKKGKLRIKMENTLRNAAVNGTQVIILRIGDFLEAQSTGNWFDTHMTAKLSKGKFIYPGNTGIKHAWGYLPDAARATTQLLEIRHTLPMFNDIPFSGTTLTGNEMKLQIEQALQQINGLEKTSPLEFASFPWALLKFLGLFNANIGEVSEMRYQWDVPHELCGTRLSELLPNYKATPTADIFQRLLANHRRQ